MTFRFPLAAVLGVSALSAQVRSFDLTTVPTKTTPQSLVVGDFNGDGKPDLAVSGSDSTGAGSVEILLNNGNGTFQSVAVIDVGAPASRIAAADFNKDGKLDLAVSVGSTGEIVILLGRGDGTFSAPANSGANPTGNLDARVPGMAVGDINGDGKPDLVLGPYTFASTCVLAVMLGNGDGTFQSPVNTSFPRLDNPKVKIADLNGDGRADAFLTGWSSAAPNPAEEFGQLLGNADGSFTLTMSTYTYPFDFGTVLTIHDVNGNSKPDVVAVDYIDYPNDGRLAIATFLDGSLSPVFSSVDIPTDSGDGLNYVSVTASDIDGDGRPDLLVSDPNGGLLLMAGGGDGTFTGPAGYPPPSPSPNIFTGATTVGSHDDYWGSIDTADFRNTGKQDVVLALAGLGVSLLENGAGSPPVVKSLVNSATLTAGPAAPGSLSTIFGSSLAYDSGAAAANAAPDTLFGLTVQGNGTDAPLVYASPTQTNIQVPWELAGQSQAAFVVTRNGVTTTVNIPLTTYAPGIFAMNGEGTGQAAAVIVTTPPAIAAPAGAFAGSRPIHPGEYLSLFGTGFGPVKCCEATGQPGYSYNTTTTSPIVTVGGQTATVQYSGAAPGLLGVYQVNILIPGSAPTGSAVPIQLSIGGVASNTVTIAIQ